MLFVATINKTRTWSALRKKTFRTFNNDFLFVVQTCPDTFHDVALLIDALKTNLTKLSEFQNLSQLVPPKNEPTFF